jgi:nicotinamidase/pyrazinamidase
MNFTPYVRDKDMDNVIFWNVDTQMDFIWDDDTFKGSLVVPGAMDIIDNLERLTNLATDKNIRVVNTMDWHNSDSKEISDHPNFMTTFPAHCLKLTQGSLFIPQTTPYRKNIHIGWEPKGINWCLDLDGRIDRDIIIQKDHFDVFEGNHHTDLILKCLNPYTVIVYGVATDVCVNYAVLGLVERGREVFVVEDAIKELNSDGLEDIFDNWKSRGVTLIKTVDVKNYLES